MLELYDTALPDLKATQTRFAEELIGQMRSYCEVRFPGVCNARSQVDAAVAHFEANKVDLIVVVHLSYAPSLISLPALHRTSLPVLLYNTQRLLEFSQDSPQSAMAENHGMHGVQDLANVLMRSGRSFELLTGHYRDTSVQQDLRDLVEAACTVSEIRKARVGVLGHPFDGMGDFGLDTTALLAQIGATVVQIPIGRVAQEAAGAPAAEIEALMADDRRSFSADKELTQEDHARSSRLEWALRRLLAEMRLDGFTMHFGAVADDGRLETVPFLAASKLLADGFGYAGEGDATSVAAVHMMQLLCSQASFTEMFTMDFANNAVMMSHMGEGNWRMARKDQPIRLIRKPFPFGACEPPASLCFALQPGPATLVNLVTATEGRLKLIASEVDVLDFPAIPTLDVPHYKIAPRKPLAEFLDRYSREGGSHHLAIAFGEVAAKVGKVARLLGLEFARI
jgi:L-arabinose isomerase